MNGDQEPEVLAGTEINRSEIHAVGDIDDTLGQGCGERNILPQCVGQMSETEYEAGAQDGKTYVQQTVFLEILVEGILDQTAEQYFFSETDQEHKTEKQKHFIEGDFRLQERTKAQKAKESNDHIEDTGGMI